MFRFAEITGRDTGSDRVRRVGRGLAAVGIGGLSSALLLIALASPLAADVGQPGYVTAIALNLRNAPGITGDVLGFLLKYDPVTVRASEKVGKTLWYSVDASGGYTNGWVAARYVEFGPTPLGALPLPFTDYGAKETPTLIKGSFKYVGAQACAECHMEAHGKFDKGASVVWSRHVHSEAYKSLRRPYTAEIAARKRNVSDPANDWRCVKCHTTAFGADPSMLAASYTHEDGVGCEVCHGPGSAYKDEEHGPSNPARADMGFRIVKDLAARRELCTSCHNTASPTYVPFDLLEFSRNIAHWQDEGDAEYHAEAVQLASVRSMAVEEANRNAALEAARMQDEARKRELAAQRDRDEKARQMASAASAQKQADMDKAAAAERSKAERKQAEMARAAAAEKVAAEQAKREMERKRREMAEAAEAEARIKADAEMQASRLASEEAEKLAAMKRAAEIKLAKAEAEEAARRKEVEAARAVAAEKALAAARKKPTGVERFLEDLDAVMILNSQGKKYNTVEFPHLAHAGGDYLPGGDCATCHHTQEGADEPEAFSTCHDIGGDAEEESAKKIFVHKKGLEFPKPAGQEAVSCVSCHKSLNAQLKVGARKGNEAPTKCRGCHTRKK